MRLGKKPRESGSLGDSGSRRLISIRFGGEIGERFLPFTDQKDQPQYAKSASWSLDPIFDAAMYWAAWDTKVIVPGPKR